MRTFRRVGVVGLGIMGAGIAEVFARAGIDVVGIEMDAAALERGVGHLSASTDRAVARGKLTAEEQSLILRRVTFSASLADLADVDLVVEAVPEVMELKTRLFTELDRVCKPSAILATNTSSLSVTAIAATTGRPEQVIGVHFFNPAPIMRLVEIVRTVLTPDDVARDVAEFVARLGKTTVTVGDRAGFVVNRLLLGYLNHAAHLLDAGIASRDDVDTAMRLGAGLPMGPFALLDLIGLDTSYGVCEVLFRESRDRRHAPAPILRELVTAGLLGRKSGRGFHSYDRPPADRGPAEEGVPAARIERVGVVGSGEQARRVTAEFARAGFEVVFTARSAAEVDEAIAATDLPGDARVSGVTEIAGLAGAGLLVEAAGEERILERAVLAGLDEIAGPDTIVATTVASIPVVELTAGLSHPGRVVGLHFVGDRVAEVAATVRTEESAVSAVLDAVRRLGREPVRCKDRAGFVVNALLYPYLNDAVRMYESGYASIEDIDTAMRLGCGYPVGPFETLDRIGLETVRDGLRALYAEYREPAYAPAPLLDQLVTAGVQAFR
ncbi:3-hydroxyacyl-CoA dehydrogenase family protein [Rhizohabitans arisaemae]|uniref:3-hydroxyacyl-CoA dehydrogenase family protein n=1 Tax=Rhizohabitans arisaemae TaxID=2720610 RepID=UPI0024B0A276|nr:3-hydroxybutyryl-CoA dehydrogenase [Rhizohabitans arisaemae]